MVVGWIQLIADAFWSGASCASLVEGSATAIAYDLAKCAAKKVHTCITKKRQQIKQVHPYSVTQKGRRVFTFDDETEGIISILGDCWPEALSATFEQSVEILNNLPSFNNVNSFYSVSRKAITKSRKKEIKLFRHNRFDIIKGDYPYIVRSLKRKNKIELFISGTSKNLEKSTRTELNYLLYSPVAQKLLLKMGCFKYSSDFDFNLLQSHINSLFSLVLLLNILRKGYGDLTVFLNNSLSSVRGQLVEEGETFLIRFPKYAPEHLGVGCSSKSDELRNQILVEMSQWHSMDVSDEDVLVETMRNKIFTIQNLIERNRDLGNINRKEKDSLESVLASLRVFGPETLVSQDMLEKAYSELGDAIKGNRKAFEMHRLWKEYERVKTMYVGGFDTFLNERSEFLVKKYKVKGSEISFLHHK